MLGFLMLKPEYPLTSAANIRIKGSVLVDNSL